MDREATLRRWCEAQYGYVAWRQAAATGMRRPAWNRMMARPGWELATPRVARAVGAPGHPRADLMLAVLDAGWGTFVGRRCGAALWGIPGFGYRPVELIRGKSLRGRRPSVGALFTVRYLPDHLVTTVAGIPVATLPFVLFQLAGIERPARTERLVELVAARSPATLARLHELLPELAERGRNGIAVMREILAKNPPGSRPPDSGLERRFEVILRDAGEKSLRRQVDLGGHEFIGRVDYVDDELGALFEVDSLLHHTGAVREAEDRERDAALLDAGFRAVARIAEEWIWYEPWRAVEVVRRTRRELRGSGGTDRPLRG